MAQALVCDGCQQLVAEAQARGRLRRLDYCAVCAAEVDAHRAAVDALQVECAERFRDGLAALEQELRGRCPTLRLPL